MLLHNTLFCLWLCLIGVPINVIVFRANKEQLPEILRIIMRIRPKHDDRDDPPSLPKP